MDDFILDEKLKPKKKWGEMSNKEFRREWNKRAEIYIQVEEGKEIERTIKMSKENGIYTKKRTGKEPEWIKCSFGIKVDELKPNESGYVNIDICVSKDGSYFYPKINDWKPQKQENIVKFKEDETEEVPF